MFKRTTIWKLAPAVAICLALGAANAHAGKGPLYEKKKSAKMSRKFFRGIGNTLFFWAEIPKEIFHEVYDTDPFTGFVKGAGEGVVKGGKRLGYGVFETFTFFDDGQRNFSPYIEPEFVMMDEVEKDTD